MQNWDDMRIFLAVARANGLSGAAPALKMDPATLGRRVARLEAAVGAPLFVKSPQGYALTDLGQRMRDKAIEAEAALALAMDEGQGGTRGLTGQIRIGSPDGVANYVLPQVVAAIQADNPGLEVQVLALPRMVNLSQREADMAVTVSPPAAQRLNVDAITDYNLHLAQRADALPINHLDDLNGRRIVGYIPDMIFDKELDYLGEIGARAVALASNSVAVQVQMLRHGGVGFVHDFALQAAPELRRVLIDQVSLTRTLYLVRHKSDRQSERLSRFAEVLSAGIKAEVARLEQTVGLTD
ncbi:DNA-binding transcriptional LysR family regulator [Loktanella ponticola]|uniref:DNA-binding transcriptional LysR family regulator n=1 Tax=Yoonia ponticola TaxID=1524255 RepID=A0A7W9BK41_9RHOB|nr:LysR family transcriptional regulator [Yoonia ponticola]MBB5721727.1 DNA-binding transcriptional LysR family regulator [Yoonia ponticola]